MKFPDMEKWIPEKRDMHWFLYMIPIVLVMMAVFTVTSKVQLHIAITGTEIKIWLFLSVISAAIVCGFAYAGLHLALTGSVAGIVSGLVFMSYVFAQPIEAPGIVGLVSGVELAFIIMLVGVNVQMVRYIIKKGRGNV